MSLGHWVVIDIETTGINEVNDHIIDLGFLHFEGTKLVRKYSSLVATDIPLSQTIQKLTGITQKQVNGAPRWKTVKEELYDLEGASFLAHNAQFEEGFLTPHLVPPFSEVPEFIDSIPYLALLNPGKSKLNLESFIVENELANKEEHRGLQDSIDLLKVLIIETLKLKKDPEREVFFQSEIQALGSDFWFSKFVSLSEADLLEISEAIDFDPYHYLDLLMSKEQEEEEQTLSALSSEFSGQNIKKILNNSNRIQQVIPHYQHRESQEEMSLKVGQSFKNGIHALIQAPTGTGKTLGYLLPSALFALSSGEQVLISTATKALQKQAREKDFPNLLKILGLNEDELKMTHLIGSKNHYCELKFRKDFDQAGLLKNFSETFFKVYFNMVFFENARGYQDFITREDFPFVFKKWSKEIRHYENDIAVDYRACAGHKCVYNEGCSYFQGIKKAAKANIVLGNHALTLNWPRSLEKPQYLVFDEAHKLEHEATKCFSLSLEGKELESLYKNLSNLVGPLYYLLGQKEGGEDKAQLVRKEAESFQVKLEEYMTPLPEMLEQYFKKMPRYSNTYWNELPMVKSESLSDPLAVRLFNTFSRIYELSFSFYQTLFPIMDVFLSNQDTDDSNEIVARTALENFHGTLSDLLQALEMSLSDNEEYSKALRFHEEDGFELVAAPINIGKSIYEGITQKATSVVLTSATLANAKGDRGVQGIEWSTGYTFAPAEKRFRHGFFLPEVFDYKKAKVVVATDTPNMFEPSFVSGVLEDISPIIELLDGRSLLLYSSRVRFEKAVEFLLKKFDMTIPVFIQGMGNNIVEDFKKSGRGILVGMESFGEGIDIPGESLKFVYIDKVPDIRMDLVTQKRRDFFDREFGNEFRDYYLSLRTRSLHQKFGRLLRTENDSGAILVTDSRMGRWKSRTLGDFKKLMEPYDLNFMKMDQAKEEILNFFQ